MEEHLRCRKCDAVWLSHIARELHEEGEACLLCGGQLDVIPGVPTDEDGERVEPPS